MPFPSLLKRRPRLPIGGQLPVGEMSDMPEVAPTSPAPIPPPRPEWRPPMAVPELEPMPQGFHPPMALPSRDLQTNNAGAFGARTPPFVPVHMSDARPSLELQRPQRAPMPDIPIVGGGGATVPDNPYDRARRDYVMEGAERNPDGSLAGDKLQFKRSGKDIALAALAGLGRGGVLGAATGALTATIDPQTGREMNFEAFHAPQIERAMDRGQQQQSLQQQQMMNDARMRQMNAQTGMLELRAADYPNEIQSIQGDREAQALERRARAESLLHPQIRPRNVVVDDQGIYHDRDTMEVMRDPQTGQPVKGSLPGQSTTPYGSSALGIYDRRTGKVIQPAPERQDAASRQADVSARQAMTKHIDLKSKAAAAQNEAQRRQAELSRITPAQAEADPKAYDAAKNAAIKAQAAAEAAMGALNTHAEQTARSMPDRFRGGVGDQGWGYLEELPQSGRLRPSGGGGQVGRKGTVGETHIQAVMKALGQSREQAIQSLRDDGYEVR